MRDQDLSSRDPVTPVEPAQGAPAFAKGEAHPASRGRRQFLKKAAATAPVILTLSSQPAWGNICAPSGRCSGNASDATPESECYVINGGGPAYWQGVNQSQWPYPNDSFSSTFGTGSNQKLKVRLDSGSEFERWAIAALLNAANGEMSYLGPDPVSVIKGIVNEVLVTGTYNAGPGCDWDAVDVVNYFKFTVGM